MRARGRTRRVLLAAAAACLLVAPAARAELRAWDQAAVVADAADLVGAIKALRNTEKRQKLDLVGSGRRAREQYLGTLKLLEQAAVQLHTRLAAGAGRDETLGVARKIRSLVRDAEVSAGKFITTAQAAERIEPVEKALGSLAPYYFEVEGAGGPEASGSGGD